MKKILSNLHHLFGIISIFLVFFIPYVDFITFEKAGVNSIHELIQKWNNPLVMEIIVFSFLPWLLFIHLSWSYLFKKK